MTDPFTRCSDSGYCRLYGCQRSPSCHEERKLARIAPEEIKTWVIYASARKGQSNFGWIKGTLHGRGASTKAFVHFPKLNYPNDLRRLAISKLREATAIEKVAEGVDP